MGGNRSGNKVGGCLSVSRHYVWRDHLIDFDLLAKLHGEVSLLNRKVLDEATIKVALVPHGGLSFALCHRALGERVAC